MTAPRDTDRLIRAFLDEGRTELPDRAFDVVRSRIDHTRQRVVIGPWREEQMSKYAMFAIAAAAVVLVAVIGIRFLPSGGGVGGQPTPTPSPTPVPTPSPVADPPSGRLTAGTYVAHPFGPQSASFTFSVPTDAWEAFSDPGRTISISWFGDSGGVHLAFLDVTSLNGDPCNWSGTEDDVDVGQTVDDLVSALAAETEYATSEPEDVTVSGYTGKKVVVTMPADLRPGANEQPGCDELSFFIWNTEQFNILAQGPENLFTLWILDVDGERVVIQRSEFADSAAERRQQLDSIFDSIVITAP